MTFTNEDRRKLHDRSSCPHYHAPNDIADSHGLERGSTAYEAFQFLWCARGKWETLERIFDGPNVDREKFPSAVQAYLFDDANRPYLLTLFQQAKALYTLYDTRTQSWH